MWYLEFWKAILVVFVVLKFENSMHYSHRYPNECIHGRHCGSLKYCHFCDNPLWPIEKKKPVCFNVFPLTDNGMGPPANNISSPLDICVLEMNKCSYASSPVLCACGSNHSVVVLPQFVLLQHVDKNLISESYRIILGTCLTWESWNP